MAQKLLVDGECSQLAADHLNNIKTYRAVVRVVDGTIIFKLLREGASIDAFGKSIRLSVDTGVLTGNSTVASTASPKMASVPAAARSI